MNQKVLPIFLLVALLTGSFQAGASGHYKGYNDPLLKRFIGRSAMVQHPVRQQQLRQIGAWKAFAKNNSTWGVVFNENSGMPHRAFGKPISVAGYNDRSTAENFIQSNLKDFNIPFQNLVFRSAVASNKYRYVSFYQQYQGLEVLFSEVQVTMLHDFRVNQFVLDCYPAISVNTTPVLTGQQARAAAIQGVYGVVQATVNPDLKILPIPGNYQTVFKLVYEAEVSNVDGEGIPGRYYTLIDAATGNVLYRTNRVRHVSANTDVNITGTLNLTHPYNPSTVEPLRNLKVVENGTTYYTDSLGYVGLANTSPTTINLSLEGLWSKVQVNNNTPAWTVNLNPGVNNLTADNNTNIKQRTAYNSVNTVHDYMKSKFPGFTGLDWTLPTNVDVAGNCNAFYDGSSINFLAAGGGCNATSLIADVCFHEYGHGINDNFYQSIGYNFGNGAMDEGYADLWALGITESPILGIGFFDNDPNGYVRRYDIDKKVYPQDLVGEVHADGEIIAGCFWDLGQNLGNIQQMMDLFTQTFYAHISGPDGTEGILFQEVLEATLLADDNDGDITNGTPNFCAITSAFAIHGIVMGAATGLAHTDLLTAAPVTPITIQTTANGITSGSLVTGFYRTGGASGTWTPFALTNTTGNNYEGTIPGQNAGTIVEYYLGIQDNCGTLLGVMPAGANDFTNPNIPYYILVGFDQLVYEDFDTFFGNWITGLPGDDAITGNWIIDEPMASYVGNALVQPDFQFTPGGTYCAVTGNASSPQAGAGENDVDGGKTTLISPEYDLTSYTNPAFTYYRWYSNDQGATPGTDFWQVAVSGDGVNWVPVENTNVADHSWRRFAFRVLDYITPTSTVSVRFIAEDANAGSLVEALVDDFTLWDETPTGLNDQPAVLSLQAYPNPARDELRLQAGLGKASHVVIRINDQVGRLVLLREMELTAGNNLVTLDVSQLSSGLYQVSMDAGTGRSVVKINVVH